MRHWIPKTLAARVTVSVTAVAVCSWAAALAAEGRWPQWRALASLDQFVQNNAVFQTAVMAVGAVLVIGVLQRRLVRPLLQVLSLLQQNADAEAFYALGRRPDELGKLAQAIGGMLTRIACTSQRLRQREQTLQSLYELAPAGLLALDLDGQILEANLRAARLVGLNSDRELTGRRIWDLIRRQDQGRLRHAIRRLDFNATTRCEVRFETPTPFDATVECVAVRDELGAMLQIRVAIMDVSAIKRLQRRLADKSRLLDLIVDHMSEAVLLIGPDRKVAAHNRRLTALLQRSRENLTGQPYDPRTFWDDLGVVDHEPFVRRLQQIEADPLRPAQERFATASTTLVFYGVPLQDFGGVSRLWVIQEASGQEQSQPLVQQPTRYAHAARRLAQRLFGAADLGEVMDRSVRLVYDVFGIEAVGVALRRGDDGRRSRQLLHRGSAAYLLEPNAAMIRAIEQRLLPLVMANDGVIAWPDLPAELPWTQTFRQAGLTGLAAVPLRGSREDLGILWVGRHGGELLSTAQVRLLEELAPSLAAWIEVAQLREQMHLLQVTDQVTGLAREQQFMLMARKLAARPGEDWSVILFRMDQFERVNQAMGHDRANALLRNIAQIIQRFSRRSTFVGRLHGPTIGLLCPNTQAEQAQVLAERVQTAVTALPVKADSGENITVNVSAAIGGAANDGPEAADVVAAAWERLEQARRRGGKLIVGPHTSPARQAG